MSSATELIHSLKRLIEIESLNSEARMATKRHRRHKMSFCAFCASLWPLILCFILRPDHDGDPLAAKAGRSNARISAE